MTYMGFAVSCGIIYLSKVFRFGDNLNLESGSPRFPRTDLDIVKEM